jgi:hypothetical protein
LKKPFEQIFSKSVFVSFRHMMSGFASSMNFCNVFLSILAFRPLMFQLQIDALPLGKSFRLASPNYGARAALETF